MIALPLLHRTFLSLYGLVAHAIRYFNNESVVSVTYSARGGGVHHSRFTARIVHPVHGTLRVGFIAGLVAAEFSNESC